jgi:LysR family nitrogen assimilation transcriptional regulator
MTRRDDRGWLDLRRLDVFLQVAEAGSFSRAATLLGISQSALSKYVRALETEVGARVFYRDGRGVQLTEAGERLQLRGRNIVAEIAAARAEVKNAGDVPSGSVAIGIQPAIGSLLAVPIAVRAMSELPAVRVHLLEALSGHILEWLAAGRIDLALYYDQPTVSRADAEPALAQDLLLVGPPGKDMTLTDTVPAARLAELPLIIPGRPHGLRLMLDALAARKGFSLRVPIEVDSAPTILRLVAKGLGHAVLPLTTIADAYRAGQVGASWIVKPRVTRTLLMRAATHRPLTAAARRVMQIVRQEARRVASESREMARPPEQPRRRR